MMGLWPITHDWNRSGIHVIQKRGDSLCADVRHWIIPAPHLAWCSRPPWKAPPSRTTNHGWSLGHQSILALGILMTHLFFSCPDFLRRRTLDGSKFRYLRIMEWMVMVSKFETSPFVRGFLWNTLKHAGKHVREIADHCAQTFNVSTEQEVVQ